jgi:hypothetical protein
MLDGTMRSIHVANDEFVRDLKMLKRTPAIVSQSFG